MNEFHVHLTCFVVCCDNAVWWFSCGIAALAMAGQLLTGTLLDADRLLQRAIEHHFSFRGEIFSGLLHKLQ